MRRLSSCCAVERVRRHRLLAGGVCLRGEGGLVWVTLGVPHAVRGYCDDRVRVPARGVTSVVLLFQPSESDDTDFSLVELLLDKGVTDREVQLDEKPLAIIHDSRTVQPAPYTPHPPYLHPTSTLPLLLHPIPPPLSHIHPTSTSSPLRLHSTVRCSKTDRFRCC